MSINSEESFIIVPKSARYFTLGQPSKAIKTVWIVCHGYGQLAKNFIRRFDTVMNEQTLVIAPEGLSKFYLGGVTDNQVGATWMTREDRLNEIADYANYLDTLLDHIKNQVDENAQIILFGFSQGVATIMRWLQASYPEINEIILYGGAIPEDIDYDQAYFDKRAKLILLGDQDMYLTPNRVKLFKELVKNKGLSFDWAEYEGEHRIYREVLGNLVLPWLNQLK